MGVDLFEWQELVLSDWCAFDGDGDPSYMTIGLDVPRQNGKNLVLEAKELYSMAVCGWRILHTAHRVKTAKKAFRRLEKYFTDEENHPELTEMVVKISRTNGEEAIYLDNGGSIEFLSRGNGTARGFDDIQLVVYDEAQELTDEQLEAILYTLSASSTGERQTIYTGTPPNEKCPGTVFRKKRASALGDSCPRRTTWSSWCVDRPPAEGSTFADVLDDVYATNPSMGLVLDEEFTEAAEFSGSTMLGFARERLCYWSSSSSADPVIPPDDWAATEIDAIADKYRAKTALAVKFAPDGSGYALAGCKSNGRGGYAVELIETGGMDRGLKGLAAALHERAQRVSVVAVDGLSGADALCGHLEELKCPRGYVVRTGTKEVIAASQGFLDAIKDGTAAHTPDPLLDEAAEKAERRPIGKQGGWGFGSDEVDPSPIEAASLAHWAARTSRRNPRRKQRLT